MRFLISLCITLLLFNNVERIDGQTSDIGCSGLNCTEDESCEKVDGVYGCVCKENHYSSQHDSFDYIEICDSSSGFLSLSRCQLFEAGFPSNVLHLNDPNCTGIVRNGRVEFYFDRKDHICGTSLVANGTHFIYENFILGDSGSGHIISRGKKLRIHFSCVYSRTQSLSIKLSPLLNIVDKNISDGQGTYQASMIPYRDAEFLQPFTGNVSVEWNKRIFVEVRVDGNGSNQFDAVMDRCWTTPVNDSHYYLYWNLIDNMCASTNKPVQVLQNGVSTSSRFSFIVFMFSSNITKVYLHCAVKLCFKTSSCSVDCNSRQGGKSASDFYRSFIVSMDSVMSPEAAKGEQIPNQVTVSKTSSLCASLMILFISMMSVLMSF